MKKKKRTAEEMKYTRARPMIRWTSRPSDGLTTPYPMHTISTSDRDSDRLAAPKRMANDWAPCERAPSRFQSLPHQPWLTTQQQQWSTNNSNNNNNG